MSPLLPLFLILLILPPVSGIISSINRHASLHRFLVSSFHQRTRLTTNCYVSLVYWSRWVSDCWRYNLEELYFPLFRASKETKGSCTINPLCIPMDGKIANYAGNFCLIICDSHNYKQLGNLFQFQLQQIKQFILIHKEHLVRRENIEDSIYQQ